MRRALFCGVALLFFMPIAVHAALFDPIFPASANQCAAGFGLLMTVINNIIRLLITLGIVFVAPIMIAWSGFLFVVNPVNAAGKEQAKSILFHTIVGIVLALSGYLIVDAVMAALYNPSGDFKAQWYELLTTSGQTCIPLAESFNPVLPGTAAPPVTPGPSIPAGEQAIRDLLSQNGITINKSLCTSSQMAGPACGTSPPPSCTNVAGMQQATVQQIINLANACGNRPGFNACGLVVTGGTEPGHACGTQSHQNGFKVDIGTNAQINAYIQNTFTSAGTRTGDGPGPAWMDSCGNQYVQESTHWDIIVTHACGGGSAGAQSSSSTCPPTPSNVVMQPIFPGGSINYVYDSNAYQNNGDSRHQPHPGVFAAMGTIQVFPLPQTYPDGGPINNGQVEFGDIPLFNAGVREYSIAKCAGDFETYKQQTLTIGSQTLTPCGGVYGSNYSLEWHTGPGELYPNQCPVPTGEHWYLNWRIVPDTCPPDFGNTCGGAFYIPRGS